MDKLEKELKNTLKSEFGFYPGDDESKRKEMDQMKLLFERFVNNIQQARLVYWVFFVVSVIIMFIGLSLLFKLSNPNELAVALFVALLGFNSTILMKLWYWTMNTKFDVLKELKQLQLQIAELSGKDHSSQD
jgi:hypothetical protein